MRGGVDRDNGNVLGHDEKKFGEWTTAVHLTQGGCQQLKNQTLLIK